jgi:hypothetical protein
METVVVMRTPVRIQGETVEQVLLVVRVDAPISLEFQPMQVVVMEIMDKTDKQMIPVAFQVREVKASEGQVSLSTHL